MIGSLAEWSKALASGASLERGVGSNPTALILFIFLKLSIFCKLLYHKFN